MKKKVLITGSGGLIGSEAVHFFINKGWKVYGIDNNLRKYFFGEEGSTDWKIKELKKLKGYHHYRVDVRSKCLKKIFNENKFNLIIHAAAQPSHDWAAKEPEVDFQINANGTLNLLENFRKFQRNAVFIYISTNKVYGDTPNSLPLVEKKYRYELKKSHKYYLGVDENMSIDKSKHSLYGVSKLSGDLLAQEYGRYFGLNVGIFRGGCLTGPAHSGTELHGFLAYLVKCIAKGKKYKIFGYKGKQVRDNIHSFDFVNAFYHFYKNPRKGEVYNLGGGRKASISILEAIKKIEKILNKKSKFKVLKTPRIGDHVWYINDVSKFKRHYPKWDYKYDLNKILKEICEVQNENK